MPRILDKSLLSAFLFMVSTLLSAQTVVTSDQQALTLAAQSIFALTKGATINDITLTGTVTWNGGADSGTASLMAVGTGESRMALVLSSGTRTEIRDSQTGVPLGKWVNPDGTSGALAFQNCQSDAVWFFPVLGSLAVGPNVVLSYIGHETHNGQPVQHLRSYVYQSNPPPGFSTQQLSAMDFYLNATTYLPVAVTFSAHPDNGATASLPTEIDFSNYQSINGVRVATHIQRLVQGNVQLDISLSSASFNTGLALSAFTVAPQTHQ